MNFKDLVESYPDVMRDRYALSFSRRSQPAEIAAALSRSGVVMLRDALPAAMLESGGEAFQRFVQSSERKQEMLRGGYLGSWHSPWEVRHGDCFPAATVMSAIIRSWIWNAVEEICNSSHIVVLLKWCMARHCIDRPLGLGGHQDAKVVAADVPFSVWVPFNQVVPQMNSGLGFVVPAPDGILPTLPHDDVGADYLLNDPAKLWIPSYAVGDLTIHSGFSPHFTTGYGTLSERFSLEIRAMARHTAPPKYVDPAIYVSRRNGIPTIVEMSNSSNSDAEAFLASADLAGVVSRELRKLPA